MRHLNSGLPEFGIIMSKSATADLDAQARNPYFLQGLWIPGSRFARPGMTVHKLHLHHLTMSCSSGQRLRI
jgi:hypothetical protein